MVWKEIISKSSEYLERKGVPDARVASELLAARLLHCGRGLLAGELGKEVPERCVEAMRRGMTRLVKGEPIQYVLGEWDFRTLTLTCDRRALIPRPETEELVTRVLSRLRSLSPSSASCPLVVDVGTGTGAIILSLAKEFKGEAIFLGTDISEDAIALAKENAAKCGLAEKVKFAVMDGLDDFDEPQCVDVIVSNPPYVTADEMNGLEPELAFEPSHALTDGGDGLSILEKIIEIYKNHLAPTGVMILEHGWKQSDAVRAIAEKNGMTHEKIMDYGGNIRGALLKKR